MDHKGINETKELLEALMELSLILIDVFKDGVQIKDSVELFQKISSDPVLKAQLKAAYEGYQKIPDEIKDLDAVEGVSLSTCLLSYIPKILEHLKK